MGLSLKSREKMFSLNHGKDSRVCQQDLIILLMDTGESCFDYAANSVVRSGFLDGPASCYHSVLLFET